MCAQDTVVKGKGLGWVFFGGCWGSNRYQKEIERVKKRREDRETEKAAQEEEKVRTALWQQGWISIFEMTLRFSGTVRVDTICSML